MIVPDPEGWISEPLEGCIAFYDESLWSSLRFPLHPIFSNVFDFYRVHPTQITPNAIRMIIIFIIMCNFLHINLRISLFRSLVLLKWHPIEKGWWYFSLWKSHKFRSSLLSSIHDWKGHFFFVWAPIPWDFRTFWGIRTSNITPMMKFSLGMRWLIQPWLPPKHSSCLLL